MLNPNQDRQTLIDNYIIENVLRKISATQLKEILTSLNACYGKYSVANENGEVTYYNGLSAAIFDCEYGQTVMVNTSVEETGNIELKDGVSINLQGNTLYFVNDPLDGFIDNGIAVRCSIFNGTVVKNGTSSWALKVTNPASEISFSVLTRNVGTHGKGIYSKGVVNHVNFYGSGGLFGDAPTTVFNYGSIKNEGGITADPTIGHGIYLSNGATANFCTVQSNSAVRMGIYAVQGSYINSCRVNTTGYRGIRLESKSEIRNSFVKASTNSAMILINGSKAYHTEVEALGGYALTLAAGTISGDVSETHYCKFKSHTNPALYQLAFSKHYKSTFISMASKMSEYFLTANKFYGCNFFNFWYNPAGHGISIESVGQYFTPSGTLFNKCFFSVVNPTAYAIASIGVPFGYVTDATPQISHTQNSFEGTLNYALSIDQQQTLPTDQFGNISIN